MLFDGCGDLGTLAENLMTISVVNNSVFRSFFEKQKLTGPNFIDWYRQLRIVLSVEDKLDYLEQPIPPDCPSSSWTACKLLRSQNEELYRQAGAPGHPVSLNLRVSLILISMRKEFDIFVQNYNMHGMRKMINELHSMLKLHEQTLTKKDPTLHAILAGKYLAELLKNNKLSQGASGSGIITIELYTFPNKSWVSDSGCGTHICNTTQGLRGSRKLKPGALSLYVGNGQRAAIKAIEYFHLCLPSGLVIILNNFHYAPSITRGIILVFRLYDDGYVNRFVDNAILVSRNNMVYFSVVLRDDIFEIDLSNSNINDSSVYTVSNKRAKLNLDSALLWHCRLGHISNKRIEKLQHDGLLNLTVLRAFGKCVSCMSEKMTRKPYTHQVERAKDLPGLIHTDVCGPFRTVSKQGASYFITFTDDFSRYGYVYLLKHKHEVFETFKVFQKEVQNQLRKTIKLLRSNRGGEYMSQEFVDHLKVHGIIAYHTPPYTPHHNEEDTHPSINTSSRHEEDDLKIDEPQSDIIPIRSSTRTRHASGHMCLYVDAEEHVLGDLVWDLFDLLLNGKTVGSKWLFKKKTDMDGAVHTFKARFVVKGFTQTYEVDYKETFSPVVDIRAIRILISIATFYDYEIWQMDVKIAFLNGHLLEESAYIEKILKRLHMENSKRRSIPMQEKLKLSKSQAVDWKSTKQSIFATSSTEAEYIAAYDASKEAIKDREKELWVELKRLFEPDFEDQLWTYNQAFMHDPLDWKLYDTCGVQYVFTKDQEIFMLVEKDYPLRKGLATVMIFLDEELIKASSPGEHLILET
nr:hypothetical protein [Tanacetum cinerariifolium]